MNLLEAMADPNLFAAWFKDAATWSSWRTFLKALFALPMDAEDLELFTRCTGRTNAPTEVASRGLAGLRPPVAVRASSSA